METIRIEVQHIVYINTSQVLGTVKYKYKTSKVKGKKDKRAHPIIAIRKFAMITRFVSSCE